MKLPSWQGQGWRQRALLLLTVVVVIALASHPELRLLVPLVDSLGLDLVLLLMGSQLLDYLRPSLQALLQYLLRPAARRLYSLAIFMLGIAGPSLDARVSNRWPAMHRI